jgi:hypothetical protein
MASKKFILTIDDVKAVAESILAMEPKSLKRWNKTPRRARGEDLSGIIETYFPGISEDDKVWTALWVDIFISQCYLSEPDEIVALLSYEEATDALMKQALKDSSSYETELEWVCDFGCLLTEGANSDIGAWFHDGMWERLEGVGAITYFSELNTAGVPVKKLETLAVSKKVIDRAQAACNESTPSKLLSELAKDHSSGVRFLAALNTQTPAKSLSVLTEDPFLEVRSAALGNPSLSDDLRGSLVDSADENLRAKAAAHANTQISELEKLAKDKSEQVRLEVAKNPNTTAAVLALLVKDKSEDVREAVAEHLNTSEETLKLLTKDKAFHVRLSLAYRDDLTEDLKAIIAQDKDEQVRKVLATYN